MDFKVFRYFFPLATLVILFPPPYFDFVLFNTGIDLTQLFVVLVAIFILSIWLSRLTIIFNRPLLTSPNIVRDSLFNLAEFILLIFFAIIVFFTHSGPLVWDLHEFAFILAIALVVRYLPTSDPWKTIKFFLIFVSILMSIASVYGPSPSDYFGYKYTNEGHVVRTLLPFDSPYRLNQLSDRELTQEEIDRLIPYEVLTGERTLTPEEIDSFNLGKVVATPSEVLTGKYGIDFSRDEIDDFITYVTYRWPEKTTQMAILPLTFEAASAAVRAQFEQFLKGDGYGYRHELKSYRLTQEEIDNLTQEEIDRLILLDLKPSESRRAAFGYAYEPMLGGVIMREIEIGFEALTEGKSWRQSRKDVKHERRAERYAEFPEFLICTPNNNCTSNSLGFSDSVVSSSRNKIVLLDVLLLLIIIFNLKLKERVTEYINKRR